ncbi:NTP pyrophosphohydrolase [Yinghuangia sp. ASG 101]|uniref:NTP pyrophosphohydrolase n=1 Tax=Yinghuangia sp. ASG 101 TaxID=2896848 RepID=UPI001E2AFBCA|nr:NTP pyrophosphohydrolase [Yinghuangia sp. ASG 101]UGQ12185.1 NTP pyrophosphohydrolase [Yinghuangia sp. ASG 101]
MADGTPQASAPLVVVDAANVIGSVPDGWWRDRLGAAERLRDALVPVAEHGLGETARVPAWAARGPLDLRLVVEGAARALPEVPGVRVIAATGSGDDAIVRLVAAEHEATPERRCLVVTADRGLRARVAELGAEVVGPRAVPRR